jgi:hypothetical protein
MDIKFYRDVYWSEECQCGKWKQKRYSFCFNCWAKLPDELKGDLHFTDWGTYGAGYERAIKWLTS